MPISARTSPAGLSSRAAMDGQRWSSSARTSETGLSVRQWLRWSWLSPHASYLSSLFTILV